MVYRIFWVLGFLGTFAWMVWDPGPEPMVVMLATIGALFRDELHAFVGAHAFSLTPRTAPIRRLTHSRYSFFQSQFINPLILADLISWLSDTGDQVVSVNVPASNDSNRYFAKVSSDDSKPWPRVTATHDSSTFTYQYLGCSFTGVHVLRTWSSGGGTGVFCDILLVTLSDESALRIDPQGVTRADRLIVKKVASVALGDRYEGTVTYRFGWLTIGACIGRQSLRTRRQRLLIV